MRTTLAAVAVLIAGVAFAQEPAKPGKEHEFLKKLEGTWDVTMKMGKDESKGTTTYKMDLNGFWLTSTLEADMGGQKFTGKATEGFCTIKKKYVTMWTDSMSASPVIMAGDYNADKKTMTQEGEGPGMDGKAAKYKSVTEFPDADTMTSTMWVGDGKDPAFTVTYKRKKK